VTEQLFVIPLWADLLAVGLGGVQGALFSSGFVGQRRLDLLGVVIVGTVMGMGGGIIRDLLLNVEPATLQNNWYLITAVAAALVGMLLANIFERLNGVIVALDAVVIGLFGAFGTSKALASGLPVIGSDIGAIPDLVEHGENGIPVLLNLGPLMPHQGVLNRQLVQAEFLAHFLEFFGRGILHRHPDKSIGAADVVADLADRDVGEFGAVLVNHAIDKHL
jgi:hypothetical protein